MSASLSQPGFQVVRQSFFLIRARKPRLTTFFSRNAHPAGRQHLFYKPILEQTKNQMRPRKLAIAGSAFACAALLSFGWSEQRGVSLSVESAQARGGRPLTPVRVAGVARRQDRRAAYG